VFDLLSFSRLLLAVGLGALIGAEREVSDKPAGLRTNILICLGAALFTLVSVQLGGPRGDPARIAAQIVSGIGFLGAGAIMRAQGRVLGMTTAASIWMVAAVGMAAGAGRWQLACGGALLALLVLRLFDGFEHLLDRTGVSRTYRIRVANAAHLAEIRAILRASGMRVLHEKRLRELEGPLGIWLIIGRRPQQDALVDQLLTDPRVIEFTW
jgi:putative Mg2+ transporter-C (MgtC) family protein